MELLSRIASVLRSWLNSRTPAAPSPKSQELSRRYVKPDVCEPNGFDYPSAGQSLQPL